MTKAVLGFLSMLLFCPFILRAQNPASSPTSRASLQGIVVATENGAFLPNAQVQLQRKSSGAVVTTQTDRDGKFYFPQLDPGEYLLSSEKPGYVHAESPITFAAGKTMADQSIPMAATGTVSGYVTDNGRPVGGAFVLALQNSVVNGVHKWVPFLSGYTNERGEYRIIFLPPGRYYIAAYTPDAFESLEQVRNVSTVNGGPTTSDSSLIQYLSPNTDKTSAFYYERLSPRPVLNNPLGAATAKDTMYVPIYYPDTPDPDAASLVDVGAGAEVSNINFRSAPVPIRKVRGTVGPLPELQNGPDGQPQQGPGGRTLVQRFTVTLTGMRLKPITVLSNPDGTFEFPRVAPGTYVLNTTPAASSFSSFLSGAPEASMLIGTALVDVRSGDDNNVKIAMFEGLQVSGTIQVEKPFIEDLLNKLTGLKVVSVTLHPNPWLPGSMDYTVDGNLLGPSRANLRVQVAAGTTTNATFTIPDSIPPGNYQVIVNPMMASPAPDPSVSGDNLRSLFITLQDAYVESIRMGDADVLKDGLQIPGKPKMPLDIIIGRSPGTMSGRVIDDQKKPVPNAIVALVPKGALRTRIDHLIAQTESDGVFHMTGLPPGDYVAVALKSLESSEWQNPEFRNAYDDSGTAIHLEKGDEINLSSDLRIVLTKP